MPYSDVYGWIRELLQKDDTELTDDSLTKWVDSGVRKLRSEWPLLPAYADLPTDDLPAMDEALGFFVAAKMRRFQMQTVPTTDIVRVHTQNTHFQYGNPVADRKPLVDQWVDYAYHALVLVSAIAGPLAALRAVSLFQASGPRRAQAARGVNAHNFGNPLWTILVDEWDYERQHPSPWWSLGFSPVV